MNERDGVRKRAHAGEQVENLAIADGLSGGAAQWMLKHWDRHVASRLRASLIFQQAADPGFKVLAILPDLLSLAGLNQLDTVVSIAHSRALGGRRSYRCKVP